MPHLRLAGTGTDERESSATTYDVPRVRVQNSGETIMRWIDWMFAGMLLWILADVQLLHTAEMTMNSEHEVLSIAGLWCFVMGVVTLVSDRLFIPKERQS